jgi:hypothetical protein
MISIGQPGDVWTDPTGIEVTITKRDTANKTVQIAGGNWTSENLASQGYTFLARFAPAASTDARLDSAEARLTAGGL